MKVLLIGGTGHVGSRLAQHLHSNSIAVSIATRRPQSVHSWLPEVTAVEIADIEDTNWQRIFPVFTHVFHLVSPQERECNQFPDEAKRIVEQGSVKIGEAVRDAGCRLIYLSTTQVYGPQPSGRITAESPTNPANTYAEVHLRAEERLRSICGSSATIVRLANSVGLPANPALSTWHLLVHDLAREVTRQQTLTLRSSGLQHRSFIAMSEVVVALKKIMSADFNGSTINIANPNSMSVLSMAEFVREQYVLASGRSAEVRLPATRDTQSENPFQICSNSLIEAGVELGKIDNIKNEIINIFTEVRVQP
jgi:nucleoside-diphosphate-sugar epimerase